ncbi:MAG TPA: phage tail protein [Acidimicrobiales bacterium]|nr:phage tail protein [Acidimicrobiales bacterium]
MRGSVDGLPSPYRFAELLPAIYQEDEFVQRWMLGFDAVLAPVAATLDNIESYFDPALAPQDFVAFLAGWVGVELDETWSDDARRELVNRAVELFKIRGTVEGLRQHVAIYAGVEPEIEESGGCTYSLEPNSALPGEGTPRLVVRVRVPGDSLIDEGRLDRLVASAKPAHIPHRVEVVRT